MARQGTLRLFIAAYPPLILVRQWQQRLDDLHLPPHRVTPPEQVHLTLLFLGDTPTRQLEATLESMQRSGAGIDSFDLVPQHLTALPDERPDLPSRLVALETDAPPPLLELQRRLATRLARKRGKPDRAYRPHLTLCRFTPPKPVEIASVAVAHEPFPVSRVLLMRSTLTEQGARHEAVDAIDLGSV